MLTHRSRVALTNKWSDLRYRYEVRDDVVLQANLGLSQGDPDRDEELFVTGNLDSTFFRRFAYRAVDAGVSATWNITDSFSLKLGSDLSVERHDLLHFTQRFNAPFGDFEPGDEIDVMIAADARHRQSIRTAGVYLNASGAPIPSVPRLLFAHGGFGNSANLIGARTVGQDASPQTVFSAELVNTVGIADMIGGGWPILRPACAVSELLLGR